MTNVYWPWLPSPDELGLIMDLHEGPRVEPYDFFSFPDIFAFRMFMMNRDGVIYLPEMAIPALVLASAGMSFRVMEVGHGEEDEGEIKSIWEYDSSRPVGCNLTLIWPPFDSKQLIRDGAHMF